MRTPFHLRLMRTVTLDRKHQQARPSARPAQHVPTGAAVGLVLCRDCGHLFPQCHCEYSPVPTLPSRVLTSTHSATASTHQYPQCHCEYSPVPTVPLRVRTSTHSATASTYRVDAIAPSPSREESVPVLRFSGTRSRDHPYAFCDYSRLSTKPDDRNM
jgi:hypothetical protein